MLKDKDIREPLFDFLEEKYGKIRIIEEKTMGRSRADIVMVTTGSIYGIEIKSDADTYARLARQVKDYDKFYDFNIAVVGSSHGMHVKEHIPDYWGIITVEEIEGIPDFYMYREAKPNPKMKLDNKLKILWRPELAVIQEKFGMAKYKEKSKDFVIDKICDLVPDLVEMKELSSVISNLLLERDYSKVTEKLTEYRKGELQKLIEKETDPKRKLELMVEQASKAGNFSKKKRRGRRR